MTVAETAKQETQNVELRNWQINCHVGKFDGTYPISAKTYYEARKRAVALFLKEFKLPGRPWEYLTTKKGAIDIQAVSLQPRKDVPVKILDVTFYQQQVDALRKLIRTGDFSQEKKKEIGTMLLTIRERLLTD